MAVIAFMGLGRFRLAQFLMVMVVLMLMAVFTVKAFGGAAMIDENILMGFVAMMVFGRLGSVFVMLVRGRPIFHHGGYADGGGVQHGAFFLLDGDFVLVFGFFLFGLVALGARADLEAFNVIFRTAAGFRFLVGDQRLPVGGGDLVIIGMDFREGEEALAVAAIFHERRLQRRFNAGYLGKIDVALERPPRSSLEIKFFDFGPVENHHAGFFRVAGVDKHALFHGILRCARRCPARMSQRGRQVAALLGTRQPGHAPALAGGTKGLTRCRS